jgi:hypothetical protein
VSARQWGPNCYAAYIPDGSRWGRFVGVCETRAEAETVATQQESPRNGGVSGVELVKPGGDSATAGQSPISLPSPDGTQVHTDTSALPASLIGNWHVGRSWTGHEIEDECPCPKEPCGLIDQSRAVPECLQHPINRVKTLRQGHSPADCPGGA